MESLGELAGGYSLASLASNLWRIFSAIGRLGLLRSSEKRAVWGSPRDHFRKI